MTSSAQFKAWLNANTLPQSRERAWGGRLYNPPTRSYYPDQRPAGALSGSYRTREKNLYEPFQGYYKSHEILLNDKKDRIQYQTEKAYSAARRNNPKAGHGRKYFRSPEEQESDYQDSLAYQRVEPKSRKHHVNTPN